MRLLFVAAACCGALAPTVVDAQSFREACKVRTLCPGVERGGGRVIACLREHKTQLSVPCRLAIAEFFLNKKGRGGDRDGAGHGPSAGPASDRDPDGPGGPRGPEPNDRGPGGPDEGPDGPAPGGPDQGPPPAH